MKKPVQFSLGILMVLMFNASPAAAAWGSSPDATGGQQSLGVADYGRLPLYFIENRGQLDRQVQFYAQGPGQRLAFTSREVRLSLSRGQGKAAQIRLTPLGMQPGVEIQALDPQEARFNYLLGKDQSRWHTDVPTYGAVLYREAYPGVDLKFYGNGRQLEYDLIVRPGADLSRVKFRYGGVAGLKVDSEGNLAIKLRDGEILVQKKPVVYQEIDGQRVAREGRFKLLKKGGTEYGFVVAAYDKQRPLVIDPVLVYSSYLGGTGADWGKAIAVDDSGCAYIAGCTLSGDFPTVNPYQDANLHTGSYATATVTKFNAAGNGLVYSTYLGGSYYEEASGIAVDKDGNAIVFGVTESDDFPTFNPFQELYGGSTDVFVTKLNPAGNGLIYSSYLGGGNTEFSGANAITVDSDGNAYVAGVTWSGNFPKQNPYQDHLNGDHDAFVTKIGPTGTLLYSTYLGGTSFQLAYAIALDAQRNIWVAGNTGSTDFPLRNPYQSTPAQCFVTQLKADGSDLLYSTYLGGTGEGTKTDTLQGLAIDGLGNICVSGTTNSTNWPLQNAFQAVLGGWTDAFITKFTPDGQALVYSTLLGGLGNEYCAALAADQAGNVYVCGLTRSGNFPTMNPIQKTYGGGSQDAFVTKFNPTGTPLFSTFLGGSGSDNANGIAVDRSGNIYVTGITTSSNFPKVKPYQGTLQGQDAFVTKIGYPVSGAAMDLLLLGD